MKSYNNYKKLTFAVLLSCSTMLAPFHAEAAHTSRYEMSSDGSTMSVYYGSDAKPFVNFKVYSAATTGNTTSYRDFFTAGNGINILNEQQAIANGIAYVRDLLGEPVETPTIRLFLEAEVYNNAAAGSDMMANSNTALGNYFLLNSVPDEYKFKEIVDEEGNKYYNADTCIWIWPRDTGWDASDVGVLSRNVDTQSMSSVIVHELFHALGMSLISYAAKDEAGNISYIVGDEEYPTKSSKFIENSYDIYGKRGQAGDKIIYINTADKDKYHAEAGKFYMYLSDGYDSEGNAKHTYDSGCYFIGDHVKDVLTINGSLANLAFPVDSNITVPGLPLNGDEGRPELSHIELQNSFLSHQYFRNWSVPMEAELAMLEDLGYNIDRRNFFGYSIYNDGLTITNYNGYFARVKDGSGNWIYDTNQVNKQDWGVGLHIYGQKNTITQAGKLYADGDNAIGIRLDGTQDNVLNLKSEVTANGKGGNGIGVTWGRNHIVNIEAGASVKATGENGVALRFDFGHNDIGDNVAGSEVMGSYIYYKNWRNTSYDKMMQYRNLLTALDGPLVKECNINGAVEGSAAAIYISKNALVKEININEGAEIKGNIISEWNPQGMWFSESRPEFLKNALPEGEDGLTNININTELTFTDNIIGSDSLVLNVAEGKSLTTQAPAAAPAMLFAARASTALPEIAVHTINIADNASYNNAAKLTVGQGSGTITLGEGASFTNTGELNTTLTGNNAGTQFAGSGTANLNGTVNFALQPSYYGNSASINWLAPESKTQINENISNVILDTAALNSIFQNSPTINNISLNLDNGKLSLVTERAANAYSQYADDSTSLGIAKAFDLNAGSVTGEAQKLVTAIDFAGDGKAINSALKKLNPSVYSNSAQATLSTHSLLNSLNMLGSFSSNIPPALRFGGRGPILRNTPTNESGTALGGTGATNNAHATDKVRTDTAATINESSMRDTVDEAPKYNSWHNIVTPFSAYTDQHNGSRGYKSHNSGVIGAMERTLENGLTHGYHAAVNHQSTGEAGSSIRGEGFYLGTQAAYAPASWKGWQAFASARLGLEQMRSRRHVAIAGTPGYYGTANADWTGYSGSFSLGTALTKEHGVLQSGPFAALDYSFAHRPSVSEKGDSIRTQLESATYDSLRTQLGYRLTTKPKRLDSYDTTKWQAHASLAWNHELLSDKGSTSYQLTDLPGVTITDKAANYGRDSMGIAAGLTFKTPQRLDVGLTLGSDIYRKGGSSVYGKVNLEWKF